MFRPVEARRTVPLSRSSSASNTHTRIDDIAVSLAFESAIDKSSDALGDVVHRLPREQQRARGVVADDHSSRRDVSFR